MIGFKWLFSLALCTIAGIPLLQHSEYRRFNLIGRALMATAVGAVSLSWAMTVLALLDLRWHALSLVGAAILVGCCLRLFLRDRSENLTHKSIAKQLGIIGVIALAFGIGIVAVVALATRAGQTTSPDLLFFWGPKAQRFARVRTIDASFLADPTLDYIHPDYPPLLTNIYAFATMAAGAFSWWAAAAVFPITLAGIGLAVAAILASGQSRISAVLNAVLMTSALGVIGAQTAVGGAAEMPLLFFEMMAVSLLILEKSETKGIMLVAGLCLAGAAGTKVEGLPFVAAVGVFLAFALRERAKRVRTLAFLMIPTVVTLGTWFLFGRVNGIFWFYRGYGSIQNLRLAHVPIVAEEMLRSVASVSYGLPFVLPLTALLLASSRRCIAALPIAVSLALIGFLMVTYLSARDDPRQLISWSAGRVLSPVAGLLCLAAARPRSLENGP
jgi:hypothetical protein